MTQHRLIDLVKEANDAPLVETEIRTNLGWMLVLTLGIILGPLPMILAINNHRLMPLLFLSPFGTSLIAVARKRYPPGHRRHVAAVWAFVLTIFGIANVLVFMALSTK